MPRAVADSEVAGDLKPVLRRANAMDLVDRDQARRHETEVLEISRAKAREHDLPMKVVSAEYGFDGSRLVVSFIAESRIDFRDLVRDLAKTFNTRIEMKQIGVRDQAKVLDGMGKCGRQLCCSSWLREFNPVTIKMAKQQNLPLNPPEISGVCGRLLCCLAYEADVYEEARKELPKVGSTVMTADGEGRVRQVHPLREVVSVKLEDGMLREYPVAELGEQSKPPAAKSGCSGCAMRRVASPPLAEPSPPPESRPGPGTSDQSRLRRRRNRKPTAADSGG
jgi:cell fate regulator YaaT (PSP1 superfamily)